MKSIFKKALAIALVLSVASQSVMAMETPVVSTPATETPVVSAPATNVAVVATEAVAPKGRFARLADYVSTSRLVDNRLVSGICTHKKKIAAGLALTTATAFGIKSGYLNQAQLNVLGGYAKSAYKSVTATNARKAAAVTATAVAGIAAVVYNNTAAKTFVKDGLAKVWSYVPSMPSMPSMPSFLKRTPAVVTPSVTPAQ